MSGSMLSRDWVLHPVRVLSTSVSKDQADPMRLSEQSFGDGANNAQRFVTAPVRCHLGVGVTPSSSLMTVWLESHERDTAASYWVL